MVCAPSLRHASRPVNELLMINPEPAQDSQSCLWGFTRLLEQTELYAGIVQYRTRDNLGMIIGAVDLLYISPMALQDMAFYAGHLN
jgi:hypothetical protein